MTPVKIIRVDPWHKIYHVLFTEALHKVAESMQSVGDETGVTAKEFGAQLVRGDRGVLLLVAVDPTGKVKGYAAAALLNGEATVIQPRLDEPTENDAVKEMMDIIEDWAGQHSLKQLTLITRRVDQKWTKKYGFDVSRYILVKELE